MVLPVAQTFIGPDNHHCILARPPIEKEAQFRRMILLDGEKNPLVHDWKLSLLKSTRMLFE
jgi:hypothetical protein